MLLDEPAVAERAVLPRTPGRLGVVALLIGCAAVVLHTVLVLRGYFWQDDFAIIQRAAAGVPYDPAFLFQDYNGHFAPGMFLLAWIVTAVAPLSHPLAVFPLLLCHAGALLAFWRLLVVCFGGRRAVLAPFTLFALSPVVLFTTLWWAFAIQMAPLLLAMAACADCHVRYLRTGRAGYAVGAALWLLAGLAFYEKAVLLPAVLFAITALLGTGPRAALIEHRKLWIGYAAFVVAFAIVYLGATTGRTASGVEADVTDYLGRTLLDTLLPGLLGGPWSAGPGGMTWPDQPALVQAAVAVVAVAVIAGGVVASGRRAALAWAALAAYVAVDLALVVVARLPLFGALIGNDPRFVAEVVPFAVLMAAFAYLPPHGEPGKLRFARPALVATALIAVGSVVSVFALAPAVRFAEARSYVTTVRASLAANPGLPVYDAPVPNDMMLTWGFGRDADVSRLAALLSVQARFDAPGETLYMVSGNGRLVEIGELANPVAGDPGPVADCGWAVTGEPTSVPLAQPVSGKHVLYLGYYTAEAGEVAVTVADVEQLVRVEAGVHRIALVVAGSFSRVDIRRTTPAAAVCVASVQVGQPWVG